MFLFAFYVINSDNPTNRWSATTPVCVCIIALLCAALSICSHRSLFIYLDTQPWFYTALSYRTKSQRLSSLKLVSRWSGNMEKYSRESFSTLSLPVNFQPSNQIDIRKKYSPSFSPRRVLFLVVQYGEASFIFSSLEVWQNLKSYWMHGSPCKALLTWNLTWLNCSSALNYFASPPARSPIMVAKEIDLDLELRWVIKHSKFDGANLVYRELQLHFREVDFLNAEHMSESFTKVRSVVRL